MSASRPSARSVPSGRTKPKPPAARRNVPVKCLEIAEGLALTSFLASRCLVDAVNVLVGGFASLRLSHRRQTPNGSAPKPARRL